MMSIESEQQYLPYEATAKAIAQTDINVIKQIFPGATHEQIDQYIKQAAHHILEGIYIGQASVYADPIEPIDAYKIGYKEGYNNAILDQ